MYRSNHTLWITTLLCLICSATGALASESLYSTLGPHGEFDGINAWLMGGVGEETMADSFAPYRTGKVGDAVLSLQYNSYYQDNSPVSVYLESDANGAPGVIIDTFIQVGDLQPLPSLIHFDCTLCPVVQAGKRYWLVALQPDQNSVDGWKYSYNDQVGLSAVNFADSPNGPWVTLNTPFSAFRIDSATPEPDTFFLLGTGILGFLSMRYKLFKP